MLRRFLHRLLEVGEGREGAVVALLLRTECGDLLFQFGHFVVDLAHTGLDLSESTVGLDVLQSRGRREIAAGSDLFKRKFVGCVQAAGRCTKTATVRCFANAPYENGGDNFT